MKSKGELEINQNTKNEQDPRITLNQNTYIHNVRNCGFEFDLAVSEDADW